MGNKTKTVVGTGTWKNTKIRKTYRQIIP